jgi:serine protease Do
MIQKIGDGILILFVLIVVGLGILGSAVLRAVDPNDLTPPSAQSETLPDWLEPEMATQAPPLDPPPAFPRQANDPDNSRDRRPNLPAPSRFDGVTRVEAENTRNWTSGTGFAIARGGVWLTARHVVIGCDRVVVMDENGRVAAKAQVSYLSNAADVAIVRTKNGPTPFALDLDESDMKLGTKAFHIGFPQGKPGEVTSKLIGRELMVTEGAWQGREQTLAFAETSRTAGLVGTLGGLSGGPAFDEQGNIIGITVAESPRRGRIVTTSASSLVKAFRDAGVEPSGQSEGNIAATDFRATADRLRGAFKVVQLVCMRGR